MHGTGPRLGHCRILYQMVAERTQYANHLKYLNTPYLRMVKILAGQTLFDVCHFVSFSCHFLFNGRMVENGKNQRRELTRWPCSYRLQVPGNNFNSSGIDSGIIRVTDSPGLPAIRHRPYPVRHMSSRSVSIACLFP